MGIPCSLRPCGHSEESKKHREMVLVNSATFKHDCCVNVHSVMTHKFVFLSSSVSRKPGSIHPHLAGQCPDSIMLQFRSQS